MLIVFFDFEIVFAPTSLKLVTGTVTSGDLGLNFALACQLKVHGSRCLTELICQ